jgi:outer membrane protein OmpA-like peptidoglycan-associated protein
MRISSAVIAAGLVAGLCTAASAQTDGWYAGAEAGVNFVPKLKFRMPDNNTWTQKQNPGYAIGGDVGYGFGPVRVEGELTWRQNGLDKINDNLGTASAGGNINAVSVMGNVFYDVDTGTKFTPYVGVGAGGINLDEDNVTARGVTLTKDSDLRFAYQGIAGVSYAVNEQLSIKADYHYIRADEARFTTETAYDGNVGKGAYQAHSVMVGFTWHFNAPAPKPAAQPVAAPPPPPAPAPEPAPAPKPVQAAPIPKNFMVFFDFDKSDLTPEAKSILTQAVDAAKKQNATGYDLTGYTDTVGSAKYNMALSIRRAESAKKFLMSLGVPANQITTHGKGKTDLLVPTGDGVREAQNRRVQIVLQ